jgi:hypothetical protein
MHLNESQIGIRWRGAVTGAIVASANLRRKIYIDMKCLLEAMTDLLFSTKKRQQAPLALDSPKSPTPGCASDQKAVFNDAPVAFLCLCLSLHSDLTGRYRQISP